MCKLTPEPAALPPMLTLPSLLLPAGRKLRCVGSGLSPNGLAFSEDGMVSLGLMDKVLDIDTASGQVRAA